MNADTNPENEDKTVITNPIPNDVGTVVSESKFNSNLSLSIANKQDNPDMTRKKIE